MSNSFKRRDFIKTASLLGASLIIDNPLSAKSLLSVNYEGDIRNDYFIVSFGTEEGIGIYRRSGSPLLTGGKVCINLPAGKRYINSDKYKSNVDSAAFRDKLGTGKRLIILLKDEEKKLDIEIQISLYDNLNAVTTEVICKNISADNIIINSLEPLRVIKNEGGILNIPGVQKCITNGAMYYNAGTVHEFGTDYQIRSDIKEVKPANSSISSDSETVNSWWNTGLFCGYNKEGMVLGYLENKSGLGQILISRTAPDQISFVAESVFSPQITLPSGSSISSDRFMIILSDNPYSALENYAEAVGTFQNARTGSVINGWCSWFYTLAQVTEDEVILNTEFASKHLKKFGFEYIQIDEGYQRWHGDWEGNERFPHGMKWLAEKIKSYGFKAGLWISPYVISEPAEVFQKHPEWMLKKADGSLKRVGNWPDENSEWAINENPRRYCLDITHPEAAEWMHNLFDTIANRWGYEMIKIDFVAWSILAAHHYHDPTLSSAQVYRKGYEIMRNAAGDKCHLLECGPGATTAGLIDSMRIEADINYGFSDAAWKTYFLDPACSASAAAKRYYFHKRTWINDADHVCINLLNNRQSEAAATIIGLSGGNMISGDRLTQLDPYKLEILKKITPSSGEAAFPVDLFDTDMQSVFAVNVKRHFGGWTIAGFFNSSLTETAEKKFSLERLRLDPAKTYLAFDFWKRQFIGEITNEIKVTVQPGSVTLITLHEKSGVPQFISTSRHILQGAVELVNVVWDENLKTLTGISTGPPETFHDVYIYMPGEHPWTWGGYVLFHDYDSYSLKMVEENILRIHVSFEKSDKVEWKFNYDEFFG